MRRALYLLIIIMLIDGCKDRYTPPVSSPVTGFLVVEGFINSGPEPTVITLSRTTTLYDSINTNTQVFEYNAQVAIEGSNNDRYPLSETSSGTYTSDPLSLNNTEQYRLHIFTNDGREYVSDFAPVKSTPPIDSISWQRDGDGVHIFINTHDNLNNTKYYQWQYEETWEYHSVYGTSIDYVYDPSTHEPIAVEYRFPDTHLDDSLQYRCWHSPHSTSILLGTTENLTQATVQSRLIDIPQGSQQLSVLYSVLVKQHALSKESYQFLQKIKKNTETLGSIFDAQPSELKGNIHCVTNPDEQVVGFMEISQLQVQRIFIRNDKVPGWGYSQPCKDIEIPNDAADIQMNGLGLEPTEPAKIMIGIISFYAAEPECVDCRLTGSDIRPDFWP